MEFESEVVKYVNQILFSLLEKPKKKIQIFADYYSDKVQPNLKKIYKFTCGYCGQELKKIPKTDIRIPRCRKCKRPLFKKTEKIHKIKPQSSQDWSRKLRIIRPTYKQEVINETISYIIKEPNEVFVISWLNKTRKIFKKLEDFEVIEKDKEFYKIIPNKILQLLSKEDNVTFTDIEMSFLLFLFENLSEKVCEYFKYPETSNIDFNFMNFLCLFFMEELKRGKDTENEFEIVKEAMKKYEFWIEENRDGLIKTLKKTEEKYLLTKYTPKQIENLRIKHSIKDDEYIECFFVHLYRKLKKISQKLSRSEYVFVQKLKERPWFFKEV